MAISVADVFPYNNFPTYNYVSPSLGQERKLESCLESKGSLISLTGPSKSGKTVLAKQLLTEHHIALISCATIKTVGDFGRMVLSSVGAPEKRTSTKRRGGKVGAKVGIKGSLQLIGLLRGEASAEGSLESHREDSDTLEFPLDDLTAVGRLLVSQAKVLVLDDFHYAPKKLQRRLAEAVRVVTATGARCIVTTTSLRRDVLTRANKDLQGRVDSVHLKYWSPQDLESIAREGFSVLKVQFPVALIRRFAEDAVGSPQLMQLICHQLCRVLSIKGVSRTPLTLNPTEPEIADAFDRAGRTVDYTNLAMALENRDRGRRQPSYVFRDGSSGGPVRAVFHALCTGAPHLQIDVNTLTKRCEAVIIGGRAPSVATVAEVCAHLHAVGHDNRPENPPFDWESESMRLELVDPYFFFFLKYADPLYNVAR